MIITIKRRGLETAQCSIERLVSTLGFGSDCDVSLATDRHDQKLGMLIQQGEGLSFRPLKQELRFYLGDVHVEGMLPLGEGEWLRVDEFELAWFRGELKKEQSRDEVSLPPAPKPLLTPLLPNRAGAMMAYGQGFSAKPNATEESFELSQQATEVKPESMPKAGNRKPEEKTPALEQPALTSAPESNRSPAEEQLMEKLKRLQTDKKPQSNRDEKQNSTVQHKTSWRESEDEILGPAWKRVVKYFYHHIELAIFQKTASERREYMQQSIKAALDATMQRDDQDTVRPRVERELESASPFDRLGLSSDIQSIRVTDKGLLSIDRGKGFGAAEMSFYNGGHVCWSFDRWLQSKGVEAKFYGSQCQALQIGHWTVNAYFQPLLAQGFLIQLQKIPKLLNVGISWVEGAEACFEALQRQRKNILVMAKSPTQISQLQQLLQSKLVEGDLIGLLGEKLNSVKDDSKCLMLDYHQTLAQLIQVAQTLNLYSIADFELESRGKTAFQQLAFKDLSYWGFVQASQPIDGLKRFELQWRLSHPQSDAQTIKEFIHASFPYVCYIDTEEQGCVLATVAIKDGQWSLQRLFEEDWV